MIVDPLAAGVEENPPSVEQPNVSVDPYFPTNNLALGLFGSGFGRGDNFSQRVAVAVGGGQVWVMAGGSSSKLVYNFDTVELTPGHDEDGTANDIPASWPTGLSSLRDLAYYGGEIYVLGTEGSATTVKVFTPQGAVVRTLRPNVPTSDSAFTGLDVAWNELWLSRPANTTLNAEDILGQEIAIFDAHSGGLKGISRNPLSERRDISPRGWWDLAIVPEFGGAIVDRRMFARGTILPGLATNDSEGCTAVLVYACASADQRGVDAPWGMRWFLEIVSSAANGTYRPVKEFAVVKRSLAPQTAALDPLTDFLGPLGTSGYYLTQKREWEPYMAQNLGDPFTLSDIAYNNREVRIDWFGPLSKRDWQRGDNQCVSYIVSDADVFIVGAKGERRYELARGFEQIGYRIDGGPLQQIRTGITNAVGDYCIDTTTYSNGVHKIQLEARVGGRTITVENTQLHIDNEKPTGALDPLPTWAREQITVTGTLTDEWSKPRDWTLRVKRLSDENDNSIAGASWQTVCPNVTTPDPIGKYSCAWDTRQYGDGDYEVQAALRDNSLGILHREAETTPRNNEQTVTGYTSVDNHGPVLGNFAPALGEYGNETVEEVDSAVEWTQTDALSGMDSGLIQHNTAAGRCDGDWRDIGTSQASGEAEVPWNTAALPNGLLCLRALARDRAGNATEVRWQAIVSAKRFYAPPVPGSSGTVETEDPQRNYAGQDVGARPPARRGAGFRFNWGTSVAIKTPTAPQPFQLSQTSNPRPDPPFRCCAEAAFTAHRVGNGNSDNSLGFIEVGLITEGWCNSRRFDPATDAEHYGWNEGWRIYGAHTNPGGVDGKSCPTGNLPAGRQWRATTYVNGYLSAGKPRIFGAMFWRDAAVGSNQLIYADDGTARSRYRLAYRAGLQGQAKSEAYTFNAKDRNHHRPMDGAYLGLRLRKFPQGGYGSPTSSEVTQSNDLHGFYFMDRRDFGVSPWLDFCTAGPFYRVPDDPPDNPCDP